MSYLSGLDLYQKVVGNLLKNDIKIIHLKKKYNVKKIHLHAPEKFLQTIHIHNSLIWQKNALYDKWNDDDDDDGYRAEGYLRSKTGGWRLGKRRGGRFEIVIGCLFRGVTLGGGTGGGVVSSGGPLKICKHQKWLENFLWTENMTL